MTAPENTNPKTHFYRFRSINNLLGDREELEKQQIYFASKDQLNDPLEGHINIYWQGDAIVWRNLFKNYLYCVQYTFVLWSLFTNPDDVLGWEHIPVHDPVVPGLFPERDELEAIFFNDPNITALIERIISSKRKIGLNELTAHLRTVHYFVLGKIDENNKTRYRKANPDETPIASANLAVEINRIRAAVEIFDFVERTLGGDTQKIEAHYIDMVNRYEENDLHNYYTDALDLADRNRIFMANDFCQAYVRRLGTMMYYPSYKACFMEDCSAASMWAYYGDSHAGVCLKFNAESDANGHHISLNTITSYSQEGKGYSMRPHHFKAVLYQAEHATLNFFEMLGATRTSILSAQWYTNKNREISPLLLRTEEERAAWREGYWERFEIINKTKTKAWEAEREHRLVYSPMDHLSPEERTLKYDFSALEGIIFGVRTPAVEKIKIIKIIEKKCRENGRFDFKFYQASFSNNQNEMVFSEIRILSNLLQSP
jgi:hypothetical protein